MRTKWSKTFIIHKGKKIYLNNTFWELKNKIDNSRSTINVIVSGLFNDKEKEYNICEITNYDRCI